MPKRIIIEVIDNSDQHVSILSLFAECKNSILNCYSQPSKLDINLIQFEEDEDTRG